MMPLLPLETFVFPERLFEEDDFEQEDSRWWVLHTRPRAEKALARRLLGRNLRFFLPQYKKQWRNNGRAFCAYLPLFSGYIFLRGDRLDRLHALETNLIARVLHVEDQAQIHNDLARVHQLMLTGASLAPEERLQPGMSVEIVSGPLLGMEGKIIGPHKKSRFFVEVQFLQQGVSVDIESWMIRPLNTQCSVAVG